MLARFASRLPLRKGSTLARLLLGHEAGVAPSKTAIVDISLGGQCYSYSDLRAASLALAERVGALTHSDEHGPARVAILSRAGYSFAVSLIAALHASAIAVPMCVSHPKDELAYVLADSKAGLVLCDSALRSHLPPLGAGVACVELDETGRPIAAAAAARTPTEAKAHSGRLPADLPALMIYTSGTTGRPKGVVHSDRSLEAMVRMMHAAWRWSPADVTTNVLPLHHVHGLVNVLACALAAGAQVRMMHAFNALGLVQDFAAGGVTLFHAVPTVYAKLLALVDAPAGAAARAQLRAACERMRLMVCGSAALPEPVLRRWQQASGHVLLERYGMTETGMLLTNPLEGERIAGSVGWPFPGVEARIVADDESGAPCPRGEAGQLLVRTPAMFTGYWGKPEATAREFVTDAATGSAWFRTGDCAVVEASSSAPFRLLGRLSADILKVGGYKISALEIERCLLDHPAVADVAVIGLPHDIYGQLVTAVVEPRAALSLNELRDWAAPRLAGYKLPRELVCMALPRNTQGKVNKKQLAASIAQQRAAH